MKLIPVVICLALISLIESTTQAKFYKPKLNLVQYQNSKSLLNVKSIKHKLPEERRKSSLFPKSKKKFVITEEPQYKLVTNRPPVIAFKKPLMKKIVEVVENKTRRPIVNTNRSFRNRPPMIQNMEPVVMSEEISIKSFEDRSEESYEKNNPTDEKLKTTTPSKTEKEDLLLIPNINPVEITTRKSDERISGIIEVAKNSKEDESKDLDEFIFLEPLPSPTQIVILSSESSEEYVTTDNPEESTNFRRKRSSNIIEEENRPSTMASYKYTSKDSRLNNNLLFKNINS